MREHCVTLNFDLFTWYHELGVLNLNFLCNSKLYSFPPSPMPHMQWFNDLEIWLWKFSPRGTSCYQAAWRTYGNLFSIHQLGQNTFHSWALRGAITLTISCVAAGFGRHGMPPPMCKNPTSYTQRHGSLYSIYVPSFKFIGLSVQKIWRTFGLSISRPGDLDLWPWNWCTLMPVV